MLYEILELPNGDVVLRRVDEDAVKEGASQEPLVSIRFSEEAMFFLDDARLDVAKAMIEAGLSVAGNISLEGEELRDLDDEELLDDGAFDDDLNEDPTLH